LKPLLEKEAAEASGYKISAHHVSYSGICPDCQQGSMH
jgi:Fe2+ or Zn2+ uptake regulation protein